MLGLDVKGFVVNYLSFVAINAVTFQEEEIIVAGILKMVFLQIIVKSWKPTK